MDERLLAVVDIETTGFKPLGKNGEYCGITEITGLLYTQEGYYAWAIKNTLTRPSGDEMIPKEIEKLTGITWDMVKYKPKDTNVVSDFVRDCEERIEEFPIIVAHNASFEKEWLEWYNYKFKDYDYIDTMALTMYHKDGSFKKKYVKNHHKLQQACELFNIKYEPDKAHRAEYDVIKTAEVVKNFIRLYGVDKCLKISYAYMNNKPIKKLNVKEQESWDLFG